MPTVNFTAPTDYATQLQDIERRRKMAEALQQQGMSPIEPNPTAGGYVIPTSWTQGLAKMLQAGLGAYQTQKLDQESKDVVGQYGKDRQQAMAALMSGLQDDLGPEDGSGIRTPEQKRQALLAAQLSPFPEVQGAAQLQQKFMESDLAREDAQKARLQERELAIQAATQMAKERALERESQIRLAASLRPPPQPVAPTMTQIVDPTNPGQMISVDARAYRGGGMGSPGVLGVSGKEPASAKREEQSEQGKQALSDSISTLRNYYDTLDANGAIVNPNRSGMSNLGASLGASGVGQFVGGMVGSKNQTIRDSINMQRPLLLQAIKQATGMSAKQMDSNAELKLWLNAATDPTKSIQANRDALDSIERKYLLGQPSTNPQAPSGSGVRFLGFE